MYLRKYAAPVAVLLALAACQRDQITGPGIPRASTDMQCTPETCDPGGGGGTTYIVRVTAEPPLAILTNNYLEGAYVTSNCGNAYADVLGQAEITCPTGGSISGTVLLRDGAIIVKQLKPGNVEVSTDKDFAASGGGIVHVIMPNDTTAWVYRTLHKAVQTAISEFQASPAQQIKVVTGYDAGAANCSGGNEACYEGSSNRIVLSSQFIYGPYANNTRFTQTHELGHAFETQAIEPSESYSCDDHSMEIPTSRVCAWGEGFADWFATRYEGDLWDVDYVEEHHNLQNGLVVELSVAATLHDWFDGPSTFDGSVGTDDDGVEWPVTYLRDVMRTCMANAVNQINGLDMLIVCMEHNALARQEAPQYFQNTWQTFTSYSESATEPWLWTADKVRLMWLYDLYRCRFVTVRNETCGTEGVALAPRRSTMRALPLLLLVGMACRAPTAPKPTLTGRWSGSYLQYFSAVAQLQQQDSSVSGTLSVSGVVGRTGTIQGVIRDTLVTVAITYTDSCGGTATGVLGLSLNRFLHGYLHISDQCTGSHNGDLILAKAPENL